MVSTVAVPQLLQVQCLLVLWGVGEVNRLLRRKWEWLFVGQHSIVTDSGPESTRRSRLLASAGGDISQSTEVCVGVRT